MKLFKGEKVFLSFTRPRYDREHKRFFPDSDRFNPVRIKIMPVTYGGIFTTVPRHCEICGRTSKTYHTFLTSDFREIYVSDHCLHHPSTAIWRWEEMNESKIKEWYTNQYIGDE